MAIRNLDAIDRWKVLSPGRFHDFLGGIGRGTQGDVWGVILTPTYFLIPNKLQAILRYQYAHGDDDGLKLQSRYELFIDGRWSA